MVRYLPNALSTSRIPIGVALVISAATEAWWISSFLLLTGALTDAFDGYLAKRWDCRSKLGENIDALGDVALSGGALLGLTVAGVWPFWVLIAAASITAVFRLIEWRGPKRLRHHPMYLLPVATIMLLGLIITQYAHLAFQPSGWKVAAVNAGLFVAFAIAIFLKRYRIREWFLLPYTN